MLFCAFGIFGNSVECEDCIGTFENDAGKQLIIMEKEGIVQLLERVSGFSDVLFSQREYLCYEFEELLRDGKIELVFEDETVSRVIYRNEKYDRKLYGTEGGKVFRIQPLHPVAQLRQMALESETAFDENREHDLVDLSCCGGNFLFDIRYASSDNFMGIPLYSQSKAFLQREAAQALARADESLEKLGFGLIIYDAYRPWYVTKMFWDATPDDMKQFVADPGKGSRHNRGCAVDVSLYRLDSGEVVYMGGGYDEFSERAYPDYPGGTSEQRYYRELLREEMENQGFVRYDYEWWHFDYRGWEDYPVLNIPFEDL